MSLDHVGKSNDLDTKQNVPYRLRMDYSTLSWGTAFRMKHRKDTLNTCD